MAEYCLESCPGSFEELYAAAKNGETFCLKSEDDYDNVLAMELFIDNISDYVVEDHGTLVFLLDPRYDNLIVVESYGGGDFYTHCFDVYTVPRQEKLFEDD